MFNPYLHLPVLNPFRIVALPIEDDRPKRHPPPATPVSFPKHIPQDLSLFQHEGPINLQQLFATSNRLTTFAPFHIAVLNLDLSYDVALDRVVPERFLPLSGLENESSQGIEPRNPHSVIYRFEIPTADLRAYRERLMELHHEKEDAYAVLRRRAPKPGREPAKVVHFRKFYSQLMHVGDYWDTSLDHLSAPHQQPFSEPAKGHDAMDIDELRSKAHDLTADPQSQASQQAQSSDTPSPPPSPPRTYTGYRTSNGSSMPPTIRTALIIEFLTPILWVFKARFEPPRSQPFLSLQKSRIPVELAGLVYSAPQRRPQRGEPILEGPLLAVQCRSMTNFRSENAQVVDLLREVGAILLLAQLRAREGKEEPLPTKDQWYVKEPRFGGGSGEAIGTPLIGSDTESGNEEGSAKDSEEEPPAKKRAARARAVREGKKARRRKALEKSWEPPQKQWDDRVRYMRSGKEEDEWDDVSVLSCFGGFTTTNLVSINDRESSHVS